MTKKVAKNRSFVPPKFFRPGSEKISSWSASSLQDRYFRLFFLTWFLPLAISVIFVVIHFSQLPQEIPLFYNRLWGQAQLAQKGYLFLPLGGATLLGLGNLAFAVSWHEKDRIFSFLLAGTASLVAILASITTIKIVLLMI